MAGKILLIDDDADDRDLFIEAFEEIAPEIICFMASDGRKALTKLNNGEIELPDVIFLDINMPVMNGWDCLKKLKEHQVYKNVPVIMCSTSSSQSEIERAKDSGALCFFSKPPDFNQLKESLEIVIHNLKNNTLSSITSSSLCL